jgi:hypothetical protein
MTMHHRTSSKKVSGARVILVADGEHDAGSGIELSQVVEFLIWAADEGLGDQMETPEDAIRAWDRWTVDQGYAIGIEVGEEHCVYIHNDPANYVTRAGLLRKGNRSAAKPLSDEDKQRMRDAFYEALKSGDRFVRFPR